MDPKNRFQQIPSLEKLLSHPSFEIFLTKYSRKRVAYAARILLSSYREAIKGESNPPLSVENIAQDLSSFLVKEDSMSMRKVINATGTIIHSNLGRSPLPASVIEAVAAACSGSVNLEYDICRGKRGNRDSHLEKLICRLTGAEAATVVNNNAAAVLIVLNTLAKRKDVLISRGELVEIGGSFRIPEIIKASGCIMKEVGTTNRTGVKDYMEVISEKTGAILKVHTSNYKIIGFTKSAELEKLSELGNNFGVPIVEDLGSGALIDLSLFKLPAEPVVSESLKKGAHIVTFSGDKLLGGPQAGIIAGRKDIIKKINKSPLKRALRVDRMTVAALEALFKLYLNDDRINETIPVYKFMCRPLAEIENVARVASSKICDHFKGKVTIEISDDVSLIGSGSLPGESIPTKVLIIKHLRYSSEKLSSLFRNSSTPIIGRIKDDSFVLDMRCIEDPSHVIPSQIYPLIS